MKKPIVPVIVERVPLCPSCGETLSGIAGDGMPKPGDFSVCAYCCAVLWFVDEAFNCRVATPAEIAEAVDKGDMDPRDAADLLGAQAEHVRRQGGRAN